MMNIFKNVDKSMLWKLVGFHILVITVSNALVNLPVELFTIKLTWSAFTFPLVVVATDLTIRLLGKHVARATIAVAYPIAIISSMLVILAEGAPLSVAMRIGFASATAYALGTLLDVYVFQAIRERFSFWWLAPAVSTVFANIIDTYTFFYTAFANSADEYMAANWMEIATSQTLLKMSVGLLVFLPAYGLLLRTISSKMNIVDEQVKKPAKVKSTPTKSKSTPTKSKSTPTKSKKKTATKTKK
jgi:queuosine precursor transporter